MVFQLNDTNVVFPNPSFANEDGLLAFGGNLNVATLKMAYSLGIFPWFSEHEPICWYAPKSRCVIFKQNIYISKSLQKIIAKNHFTITLNTAFAQVIQACKITPRKNQNGTWITTEMEQAYINLYNKGVAHSVEVWQNDRSEERRVGKEC